MHATDFGRTLIIANPAAQSGAAHEVAERLLAGEQRAKILAGEIVDVERLGKIVAGAHGQDGKSGAGVLLLRHKPVDDLVDHAIAAKGDNGAIALSLCGKSLGMSHALG